MSASGTALGGQVPGLGEHGAAVLQALLGLGEAELGSCARNGCSGPPRSLFERGRISPVIDQRFALADIGRAFDKLARGEQFGKRVVTPP